MELTIEPENGRGCGTRSKGGVYACCGLSVWGKPIEYFLLDPVRPIPWQRGSHVIPRNDGSGLYDLLVYIGVDPKKGDTEGYPSAWSFIEEARHYGVSRKQSPNLQWHLLTPGESNMILAHPRAFAALDKPDLKQEQVNVSNMHRFAAGYVLARQARPLYLCKQFQTWVNHRELLVKMGWSVGWDVRGQHFDERLQAEIDGQPISVDPSLTELVPCVQALRDLAWFNHAGTVEDELDKGMYHIEMPSFSFTCKKPLAPYDGSQIKWMTAAFAAIPLTHFEIPDGPQDEKGAVAAAALEKAGFVVAETDY